MYYGVSFDDYHSLDDWGLYLAQPVTISPPEVQSRLIDVPGRDGSLDLTEALDGKIHYYDRELEFNFVCQKPRRDWPALHQTILDALHGRSMKIVLDEDSDYYYTGRISVDKWDSQPDKKMEFPVIRATVGPFKWEPDTVTYSKTFSSSDISASQQIKVTAGKDVSKQSWNTDLRYGTATIPTFDWSGYKSIYIKRVPMSGAYQLIQFVDGSGGVYNYTPSSTETEYTVTIADLEDAGLDTSTIYRILLSGASSATVYVYTNNAAVLTVEGATTTTVPEIYVTSGITTVSLDGTAYTLSTGWNYADELYIQSGENNLIFSGDFSSGTVQVTFRRGWL